MKHMGWSWVDLMTTPQSIVDEIYAMMEDQARESELNRLLSETKG